MVVADPSPVWYSLHPCAASLASQPVAPVWTDVYPGPTVYFVVAAPVSTLPTTNELALGVKEPTLAEVDPADEAPVDERVPEVA